ncbi:hypothetical protein AAVH_23475 [Aphelenchoides avenae]|nr:hypothetical protein AAVH_23475 [Aphelenchus avenae]
MGCIVHLAIAILLSFAEASPPDRYIAGTYEMHTIANITGPEFQWESSPGIPIRWPRVYFQLRLYDSTGFVDEKHVGLACTVVGNPIPLTVDEGIELAVRKAKLDPAKWRADFVLSRWGSRKQTEETHLSAGDVYIVNLVDRS